MSLHVKFNAEVVYVLFGIDNMPHHNHSTGAAYLFIQNWYVEAIDSYLESRSHPTAEN
jgi:hypothetical protein